jgi:hypothetical protein
MKELIKIQKALSVPKGREGGQGNYKYRSVDDILSAVKKLMPDDFMLVMSDEVVNVGNRNYIKATVLFTNGVDSIQNVGLAWEPDKIASMSGPQITGSCSSYARKLALCGLFMIDDSKDVDSLTAVETGGSSSVKLATKEQRKELKDFADGIKELDASTSDYVLDQLKDDNLPYSKAAEIIRRAK